MVDRNEGFADHDFAPPERKVIRGVVHRENLRIDKEERRTWLLEGIKIWLKWAIYGAPALMAAYVAVMQFWKVLH